MSINKIVDSGSYTTLPWVVRRHAARSVVDTCKLLALKGLIAGLDGNVSVRIPRGNSYKILVTPSGVRKEGLQEEDLVLTDADGVVSRRNPRDSGRKPTSEINMRCAVYHLRPDVGAVVHAHPPATVALTLAGVDLTKVWLPETVLALGRIGVADYATPTTRATADAVGELIRDHDVVLLPRHGTVTVGRDLEAAYSKQEALEHASRIIAMAMGVGVGRGRIEPLPESEVAKLFFLRG